ncbi:PTH1 family peptidyl-tRNA hydrolase [Dyadobacter sp. BE34]|uniref:Peptidyl-tRNA hydrolase n=1 Tax=Dyadobacter fermentans TaxID=94254 RepID=A0ABU1R169_9BACT|nr:MULTISPECIES: aminoacyl-tRNA hydrolase [Dyadobacter]MDR6807153.1 PTH1 family peptidyl-tRNA hydrolase [Dyadobacter fermentans]MDR7044894.1 PTH1 family peptidyl-tRNA hydrolase [Dyadobacter sp. BE242]MDR7199370.1 PTH1 family peptidyl-tRNA hydrolase [Dyadobacter sp. BE34]MDR7217330.1 PTH1 family peptidyl-tRNA hydrolase [Dyadobacter sp. BE31]MDR7265263.1 PTH1 family peptidyl-tRNA hydrolase [Dyadobacter sp. BE32]
MKYLIAGLGNIGPEYAFTRHNAGFMVLDRLAAQHDFKFSFEKLAFVAEWKYKGRHIYFIKPTTYMNLSGKAIRYYMDQYKVATENTLTIVDELQLPFGTLRIKPKGSHGGHNGLKNIEELLGTTEYPKLRFGIGNNFPRGRQVDYVLKPFSNEEMAELPIILDKAGDMVTSFCTLGIQSTMNNYNQ